MLILFKNSLQVPPPLSVAQYFELCFYDIIFVQTNDLYTLRIPPDLIRNN